MLSHTENDLISLRKEYPIGTRIRLTRMDGEKRMYKGLCGTVTHIDAIGTIHMNWDNGSTLGLIPDTDQFEKI